MSDIAPDTSEFDDEPLEVDADGYEVEPPDDEPPVSVEDRARAQGWRPGKRTKEGVELTPQEFLDRGEEEWPILRHNNKIMSEKLVRTENELANLRNTIAEQTQAVQEAIALAKRADDRGYNRALAELKAQRRAAALVGDETVYDQVDEQIDAMESERDAAEPVRTTPAATPAVRTQTVDPDVAAFARDTPWFNNDPVLRNAMIVAHNALTTLNPTVPQGQLLTEAVAQVARAHPGRIPGVSDMARAPTDDRRAPQERPRQAAPVMRPGGAPASAARAVRSPLDSIADPEERSAAKAAFQRQKAWDPGFTEAEYMKIYSGDPEATDVLALRQSRKK